MKKLMLALIIALGLLTFAGAGYVLSTGGEASPGYAVIPMLCCLCCLQCYLQLKRKDGR